MAYKIAVASSDGIYSDLEFGMADQFYIYDVDDNARIKFSEIREWKPKEDDTLNELRNPTVYSEFCGNQGNRCGKGSEEKVKLLEDCRCIICTHIGPKMSKQFTVRGISIFDIEGELEPIIKRIAEYYK
ncbi:Predicted Fe-Mo cluster-binding protein, NifX family [Butyrivibrio sp. ob235]|uniref:NifB/NifX family molybdenum-iron cluster-binding protein n=1 Tax=Butyrivibrio sp. ob235 TaxID=1761780 RepID=UPI0008CC2894|nr:NifB/NifX family molybdenum-iron cluster-binding protein [Butyrivibrio sp. ob235]SEL03023.1 Predicted Fe-Mo cluster-binding protein, NifX family [Butyrivibrio sp. ob235]